MLQISSQSTDFIKHVHQKLTMSRLNGHDSLQRTSNVKIIQSKWWRNNSSRSIINVKADASPEVVPVAEGGRGAVPEGSTLGRLELGLNWAAFCLRKVAPMWATIWIDVEAGKSSNPKRNKIRWMKTGKKRAWLVEALLWTLFKEQRNRWGKLIGASVTRAYKNAHRSRGMVWIWEIGHKDWEAILKKR